MDDKEQITWNDLRALHAGIERLSPFAPLLNKVNVFPVPDGDTGRNLIATLAPLRLPNTSNHEVRRQILMAARGNSGNIAARFLAGYLDCPDEAALPLRISAGRESAYKAISEPKPGTMLTLFEVLETSISQHPPKDLEDWVSPVLQDLVAALRETPKQLPELGRAGVLDAGALGMFLFLEGMLSYLGGLPAPTRDIFAEFAELLTVTALDDVPGVNEDSDGHASEHTWCIDAIVRVSSLQDTWREQLDNWGDSIIASVEDDFLKLHIHAEDPEQARSQIESLGEVVRWTGEDITTQISAFRSHLKTRKVLILTDAAGTLTISDAESLGVVMLDSYVLMDGGCTPESAIDPTLLYGRMREGSRVTTAQASDAERAAAYQTALGMAEHVVYLCVGSAFTGNFAFASNWAREQGVEARFSVIDTGAASGRLGVFVRKVTAFAEQHDSPAEVVAFARKTIKTCGEMIFLDKLKYLAQGGRVSNVGAFFGDLAGVRPVISPGPEGVEKRGVARTEKQQLQMAIDALEKAHRESPLEIILVQHTDVASGDPARFYRAIRDLFPEVNCLSRRFSITSGVHCGPGTWAIAWG